MRAETGEVLRSFRNLEERLPGPGMSLDGLDDPASAAILEIAGRDSIAAALSCRSVDTFIPTIAYTGTEYGDPAVLFDNISFLEERLAGRARLLAPVILGSPRWWAAVNGRPLSMVQQVFGHAFLCAGCHMYLHALRVLLAGRLGVATVISGERERHGGRMKMNQSPPALDAFVEMAARYGVELAHPLRRVDGEEELATLVGDWPEGRRQRSCVLSGNYLDLKGGLDDSHVTGPLQGYLREFLLPVTTGMLDAHLESVNGRVEVVRMAEIVRTALAGEAGG